jgi:hypothetical protein
MLGRRLAGRDRNACISQLATARELDGHDARPPTMLGGTVGIKVKDPLRYRSKGSVWEVWLAHNSVG